MIEREQVEQLIHINQRMQVVMAELVAEHRREGRLEAARHAAGVVEGLSIMCVQLHCLLEPQRPLVVA